MGNSKGYSFGYGEGIGMLVDREKCSVQMFRDGVPLEGALLQLKLCDFSFQTFRLVVDLAGFVGTTATLSVPENLPPLVVSVDAVDKLRDKVAALEAQQTATKQKKPRCTSSPTLHPVDASRKNSAEAQWLIGGKHDSTRAARTGAAPLRAPAPSSRSRT